MKKRTKVVTEFGTGVVYDYNRETGNVFVSLDRPDKGPIMVHVEEVTTLDGPMKKGTRVITPRGFGTVIWSDEKEVDVRIDDDDLIQTFLSGEVSTAEGQADRDLSDSQEVWVALNFIYQLRQYGDEPWNQFAEILEPLARAYKTLKEKNG